MKIGFFIWRFQPAHQWHLQALLDMHATWVNHFIIGVWSAQKEWTEENPFTYTERKKILELLLQEVPFTFEIHAVPDVGNDEQWFEYITTNLPKFDVVLSGNPRLEWIFKPKWYEMFIPEIKAWIKGTNTRKAIALEDHAYLDSAINSDIYAYLKEINAPSRLQTLMPGLQSFKVQYSCLLDDWTLIQLPSSVPYIDAHTQIISYIKEEKNIDVILSNLQPIWREILDTNSNIYSISLQFSWSIIIK